MAKSRQKIPYFSHICFRSHNPFQVSSFLGFACKSGPLHYYKYCWFAICFAGTSRRSHFLALRARSARSPERKEKRRMDGLVCCCTDGERFNGLPRVMQAVCGSISNRTKHLKGSASAISVGLSNACMLVRSYVSQRHTLCSSLLLDNAVSTDLLMGRRGQDCGF